MVKVVNGKVNVAFFVFGLDVSNASEDNDKGEEPVDKTEDL